MVACGDDPLQSRNCTGARAVPERSRKLLQRLAAFRDR